MSIFPLFSSCGYHYEIYEKVKNDTERNSNGVTEYVVNTSSYSYHLSSCYIVNGIKEENKIVTTDIEFLVERQYSPCKKCIKD